MEASLGKNPRNYEEIRDENVSMNKSRLRLMILMKMRKKKSNRGLKNESKKEERLLKITSFSKKKKK